MGTLKPKLETLPGRQLRLWNEFGSGRQYDPLITLQALTYFDDLSFPLEQAKKDDLRAAVGEVALGDLPIIVAGGGVGREGASS